MAFFQNTRKPEGLGGKVMVNMMNSGHAAMAEWGFRHIEIQESDLSLDLGCGGGANVKKLLEKTVNGKVKGLDYSEVSVKKSKEMNVAAIKAGWCEILHGNVMNLPFSDDSFDVITAFETIYFWPDLLKAFEQVFRVLKDHGLFMICNESNGENPKDEKWLKKIDGMKIYTSSQIQHVLEQAGFSNIKTDVNEKGWLCIVAEKTLK